MSARPGQQERAQSQGQKVLDWRRHPSVNSPRACPWCGRKALHEQHCKQICLACGWYRSCVD